MIWDVHCHLSNIDGRTPEEKMAQLLRFADRLGVDRLVLHVGHQPVADPSPAEVRRQNDQVLQAISHYYDRVFAFVYRSGKHPDFSVREAPVA